jgi:hypothetical protein
MYWAVAGRAVLRNIGEELGGAEGKDLGVLRVGINLVGSMMVCAMYRCGA